MSEDPTESKYKIIMTFLKEMIRRDMQKLKEWTQKTITNLREWVKNSWDSLKKLSIIQVIVSLVIFTAGIYFVSIEFKDDGDNLWWLYGLIFLGIVFASIIWIKVTRRYFSKFIYLLTTQKYTRKIIAGGSFSYFEYKDPSKETVISKFTEPIGIIITTLITLLGIATTVIGLLRDNLLSSIDLDDPIMWGVLALISPILATPIIPIVWAMDDAKIKSWNMKNNTTWMVSHRYKRRFNSIIAVSAVISNIKGGVSVDNLVVQLEIMGGILSIGAMIMLITIGYLIIYYYAWFRSFLRKLTVDSLDLKCYEVSLEEKDVKQFETEEKEKEEVEVLEMKAVDSENEEILEMKPVDDETKEEEN